MIFHKYDQLFYKKENKVGVINASILSMGILTNRGPPAWHPANEEIKAVCKSAAAYCQVPCCLS